VGRLGWPLDAVGQRLIKDSVVVNLAGFAKATRSLGRDLRSIGRYRSPAWELARGAAQALVKEILPSSRK